MISASIRVTTDNRRKAARALGHTSFTRFLRELGTEGVALARKWARHMIYDTAESPSYRRTWRLFHSIGSTVFGDGKIRVYAGISYARYVHDGTRHMSPRPFLDEGLKELDKKILAHARIHYREIL